MSDVDPTQTTDDSQVQAPVPTVKFDLPVDANNKATVMKLFSIKRPHMRAFHFAWFSFFLAFFGWFALAPLQKSIRDNDIDTPWLNDSNFKAQNIIAVAGTLIMRLIIGPVCDRFGPRVSQTVLLTTFSLPVFLVGTSQSYWQWTTARFFIGFIGAAFVVTQFWTSIMFSGNIVGTANATSAGWGNMGGGVTNALMPQIRNLVNLGVNDKDKAWRISMVIPGCALIITGIAMFFLADDLPEGNYRDLHKAGTKEKTNPFVAMGKAAQNWRVWVLFLMYAGCFGVELIMNGNLATYFGDRFGVEDGLAGLLAALFGLMNLFARSLGGLFSDFMAKKFGMRGRLWAFFALQISEGALFVLFSRMTVLGAAIPVLVCFSLFVQMAEGCTFGIVPFVDPTATGAVSGIVGAGGNFGAVAGGFLLSSDSNGDGFAKGFLILGFIVMGTSFLITLLHWPQYGSMFRKPSISAKVLEEDEMIDEDEDEVIDEGVDEVQVDNEIETAA